MSSATPVNRDCYYALANSFAENIHKKLPMNDDNKRHHYAAILSPDSSSWCEKGGLRDEL